MSRFHEYNNEFDEDDDGEDLEISDEEEAASDNEGREQAALLMAHCESIVGNRKVHEDQRRMWFRMAKQALAEGAERREAAEAEEEAQRREERARIEQDEQEQRDRELDEREARRAEIRWRNAEAAWMEAEAARARVPARTAVVSASAPRPVVQAPVPIARPSGMPSQPPPAATRPTASATARPPAVFVAPGSAHGTAPRPRLAPAPTPPVQSASRPPERTVRVLAPTHPLPRKPIQHSVGAVRTAPVPTSSPSVHVAEARPGAAREGERLLTGDDLVRWRTRRGITQRAAAEQLGVAPSTVAKAELVPSKHLGEQLQVALRSSLAR